MTSFKISIIASIFLLSSILFSQSKLYMPKDIKEAYTNQTRSLDGLPGSKYWQNKSHYFIKVKINPEKKIISGSETIKYFNNSPNQLRNLILRLYPDLYKYGNARNYPISKEDLNDGVKITKAIVNGKTFDLNNNEKLNRYECNLNFRLDSAISPNSITTLEIDWEYKLAVKSTIRTGAYDSTSFFVAYWYPQMSVYDDVDGWDRNNYNGEQEFYNDFSDYDVEISVPNDFGVWATGILQNPDKVLTNEFHEKYHKAKNSDSVFKIISVEDLQKGNIYNSQQKENTWHFTANNVPDFAFALSNHYLWDGVSLQVDDKTGRKVFIAAVYKKESKDFFEVAEIAKNTINMFSRNFPAVPFPYPCLTVFNGQGGMEYPMMVNDGSSSSKAGTVGVTSHEIAHTYFPFYMGINERKYAWMDEGMATFLPYEIQLSYKPERDPRVRNTKGYSDFAGNEFEMPLMIPSMLLHSNSYRVASYVRSSNAYYFLRDALGTEKFDSALRVYMNRWNGKHPIPYDFFFTFENFLKEDLSWYFKPWFFEFCHPDLAIKEVKKQKNKLLVTIENAGGIPVPISLKIKIDDNEIKKYDNASVWKNGNKTKVYEFTVQSSKASFQLGDDLIPDTDSTNNKFEWIKK